MDTTAYYAFIAPTFFLLVGLEALVAHWRGRPVLSYAQSFGNLSAGLGALFVGLFVGPFLYGLYDWAWRTFALFEWHQSSVWPWVAGLLMADLAHYWQHRLDHQFAPLWAWHGVHHQGTEFNLTLSMRHTWGSDFYSFPFYALLPLLGVPPKVFFLSTVIMSVHAMFTHSSELRLPSFGVLVTPQSHKLHHAKNLCYLDKNYGGLFCIWDKIWGTHATELQHEPPLYGIDKGYSTHDGALCQWHQLRDFWSGWSQLEGMHQKWKALFSPPTSALAPWPSPRPNTAIGAATKWYTAVQFVITTTLAMYVLNWRDQHSMALKITTTIFVVASLLSLGGLLDQRKHAWRFEWLRLLLGPVAVVWALG
jgi:alkylglycerol monooxygenase